MIHVLFVCIHNSARSQMAETYLNHFGAGKYRAQSAGIEPGKLNQVVVKAMHDDGFDISGNGTKSVEEMLQSRQLFDFVVTVCDEASAERCPVFPGPGKRLHWGFPDPSSFGGDEAEKLKQTIIVRNAIRQKVQEFVNQNAAV
ncbi:MAG: arsenate reductase ArsC [Bacteroidetes bacterium]|nr:arsenate reductase ArsC [Bacteroidota bacterium]